MERCWGTNKLDKYVYIFAMQPPKYDHKIISDDISPPNKNIDKSSENCQTNMPPIVNIKKIKQAVY